MFKLVFVFNATLQASHAPTPMTADPVYNPNCLKKDETAGILLCPYIMSENITMATTARVLKV